MITNAVAAGESSPELGTADTSNEADPAGPKLFRTIWRWHFYAGLLVIPILVVLCISGIVYLFKPQIDGVFYGHLRDVLFPLLGISILVLLAFDWIVVRNIPPLARALGAA